MGLFLRHLELILTAVGLLLILVGSFVLHQQATNPGLWSTALATSVGTSQGLVLWIVRSKQRDARDQTIRDVQSMLQDVVNNQLVVIQMADQINRRKPGAVPGRAVQRSVGVIYEAIASLSHESLHAWTLKYRTVRRRVASDGWQARAEPNEAEYEKYPETGSLTLPSLDPAMDEPSSSVTSAPLPSSAIPQSDVRLTRPDEGELELDATAPQLKK